MCNKICHLIVRVRMSLWFIHDTHKALDFKIEWIMRGTRLNTLQDVAISIVKKYCKIYISSLKFLII